MVEMVFFLEERSAKAMLEGLLPRIIDPGIHLRYIPFEGKQDLEKNLSRRLRGYHNQHARFVVIRDQDSNPDCVQLKNKLKRLCLDGGHPECLVRIACRELEAFYLADLLAVEKGLNISGLARQQQTTKFRAPDYLGSPSRELLQITQGRYQKVGGSRSIGPHLDPENSRSASFRNLVAGLRRIASPA